MVPIYGTKPAFDRLLPGLTILTLLIHVWSLLRYPAPFVDEVWLLSRAWTYIQTGLQFGPLDSGLVEHLPTYWRINQWLYTVLQSIALLVGGGPSLAAVRLLALVWGIGLLAANYLIASHYGGRLLGITSTFLLALSKPFFYSAHSARYDILAVFLGYSAVALVVNRRNTLWSDFFAGLLTSLAVIVHLNSIIFGPVILSLYLLDVRHSALRIQPLWTFLVGGVAGFGFYLGSYILVNSENFWGMDWLMTSSRYTPPILSGSVGAWLHSISDTGILIFAAANVLLLLIPFGVYKGWNSNSREFRMLLLLNIALLMGVLLFFPGKSFFYAIFLTPALLWVIAWFLNDLVRIRWRKKVSDYVSRVLVWGIVIGFIALSLEPLRINMYEVYLDTQIQVNQVVRPGESLMGSQTYWLGLTDHPYRSWELLEYPPTYQAGATIADTFNHFRPDVFLFDRHINALTASTSGISQWGFSSQELQDYLNSTAQYVTTIMVDYYGPIIVYRFHWNN